MGSDSTNNVVDFKKFVEQIDEDTQVESEVAKANEPISIEEGELDILIHDLVQGILDDDISMYLEDEENYVSFYDLDTSSDNGDEND